MTLEHGRARRNGLVHVGRDSRALCGRLLRHPATDEPLPTCRSCLRLAQRWRGLVYLIHFDEPYRHARHYMGWTKDLAGRLACHRNGTGATLMRVVTEAGIGWRVVAVYYGDRNRERAMKNHGHARRCPVCRAAAVTVGRLSLEGSE